MTRATAARRFADLSASESQVAPAPASPTAQHGTRGVALPGRSGQGLRARSASAAPERHSDPAHMRPEERLRELGSILSMGVRRLHLSLAGSRDSEAVCEEKR